MLDENPELPPAPPSPEPPPGRPERPWPPVDIGRLASRAAEDALDEAACVADPFAAELLASHVVDASARAHHVVGEFFTRPLAEQLIELLVASPRPGARALLRAMESCGDRRTACTVRERAHDVLVEPAPEWELAIGKGRVAFVQLKNYRLSGQGAVDTLYFDLAWPDETEAELALSFDQAGVDRFTYAAAGHSLCDLDRMLLIGNGMSAGTAHPLERAEARVAAGLRHDEALRRTGAQSALDGLRGLVRSVLAR